VSEVATIAEGPSAPGGTVLVVDDEAPVRHMLRIVLEREGYDVREAEDGDTAVAMVAEAPPDVLLTDVRMAGMSGLDLVQQLARDFPDITLVVMSAFGSVELAMEALNRGAYDYISKPFKQDEVVMTVRKAQERERLRRENLALRARIEELGSDRLELGDLLVHSAQMREVARLLRKVARFKSTALVLGESGVGKELASRAIHHLSPRAQGPFVAVNCGAIPDTLIESELFGHVKGAFTDATSDRRGLFEEAVGGTLLLDEIGELPSAVQVKLLRALQEEEVRRVGETTPRSVDVRVIAATSRALEDMVAEGSFRQDLYFRLNVFQVTIPPLRARKEDIAPLVQQFLGRVNKRLGTEIEGVTADALAALVAYGWPGNIRELENAIEHASVLAEDQRIAFEDLPERVRRREQGSGEVVVVPLGAGDLSVKRAGRALERELILRALEQTDGNRTHAAKVLDLSHRALLYKIKEFGLS
jgi:two-component system response regulator AtoC